MSVGESIQDMVNITLKNEINRIEELILKNIEFSYHHKILLDREIQLINELLRKIDMEKIKINHDMAYNTNNTNDLCY